MPTLDRSVVETDLMLTPAEVALQLNLTVEHLSALRGTGQGAVFQKFGHSIRYRQSAITEWIANTARKSTSDPGPLGDGVTEE